jgi:NADH dehydrogenase [ubiquinone] 1 alpha subcomplex assembly factor 1
MQKSELPGHVEHWLILNDSVMGGLSQSQVCETSTGLEFRGYLSLKNNDGFASIRKTLNVSLDGIIGFRLVLKGDGHCYQFRLRPHRPGIYGPDSSFGRCNR